MLFILFNHIYLLNFQTSNINLLNKITNYEIIKIGLRVGEIKFCSAEAAAELR